MTWRGLFTTTSIPNTHWITMPWRWKNDHIITAFLKLVAFVILLRNLFGLLKSFKHLSPFWVHLSTWKLLHSFVSIPNWGSILSHQVSLKQEQAIIKIFHVGSFSVYSLKENINLYCFRKVSYTEFFSLIFKLSIQELQTKCNRFLLYTQSIAN